MDKFKEYVALVWHTYRETAYKYPVRTPMVALAIGFALGYWVG